MRTSIATFAVASIALLAAPAALAAPTQVNVRIEGRTQTLFEGPILTTGHNVEASSDAEERPCDGIDLNDPGNLLPDPTPTGASADAMSLIGETFDGKWYPGYEDYFITRWGPDREATGESWGILVNNVFTDVGGCQYELSPGDEVLWVYNAFEHKPLLALYPAGETSGARPLTATAALNEPFTVEVLSYDDGEEDKPPPAPERTGSAPYEGASVSPVKTAANGFEKVETDDPATVKTDAEGRASITFTEPGWHRIKATAVNAEGEEDAIRSNRLDVCVPPEGASGCGEPPAADRVRTPPAKGGNSEPEGKPKETEPSPEGPPSPEGAAGKSESADQFSASTSTAAAAGSRTGASTLDANPLRVEAPHLDGQGARRGLIGVSWRVLDPGVGLRSWTIASKRLSKRAAGYVTRATGTNRASALLGLPSGAAYQLQITFTDVLGRSSTAALGRVLVPRDDRASALRAHGRWRHVALSGAWLGTVSRGMVGAQISVQLAAGKPVFVLRGMPRAAKVEVLGGSHREVFTVARGSGDASRLITASERSRAGTVGLRVLSGAVDLDGVAVEP